MSIYARQVSRKKTPQSQPIPGKKMKENSAGGFSFEVDKWEQLQRFLILGSEGGTYYIDEQSLTRKNASSLIKCISEDGVRVVNEIVRVSQEGRAPKNSPAIFALALAVTDGDEATRKAGYDAISQVCRIGTHIFEFCASVQELRKWSRGLRRGVGSFYTSRSVDQLAYQLIKYQQRNGWTHQDVLRLAHPKSEVLNPLFRFAVGKATAADVGHSQILAAEEIKHLTKAKEVASLITKHSLPREVVPTQFLNEKVVWEALLESMPATAMMRNLGKMTSIGLLDSNLSNATKKVVEKLSDLEVIRRARLHPLNILTALKTYQQGHGVKGSLQWSPSQHIVDVLDQTFYKSFTTVEPTNQNWMLALDVSGSMSARMAGSPVSCMEGAAAMAMVTAAVEPNHELTYFSSGSGNGIWSNGGGSRFWGGTGIGKFQVSARSRLDQVVNELHRLNWGGTDCALPMLYATAKKIPVDTFVVYTDSETWAGDIQPVQALDKYRQKMGRPAKLVVVGMTSNGFSIADPNDAGMLDVVGFDPSVPGVMAAFSKGI